LHRTRTRSGRTTSVHSQSIDLEVARGDGNAGTALGTAPIYTPREAIARKTTLMADHLLLFIVIYPGPVVSTRVEKTRIETDDWAGKKCLRRIVETLSCRSRHLVLVLSHEGTSSKKQSLMGHRGLLRVSLLSFSLGGHFTGKRPRSFDFHLKSVGEPSFSPDIVDY